MATPSSQSQGDSFRVLRTARVAPSWTDGAAPLPERAMPLTFLDAMFLSTPAVERVLLSRLGAADDVDAVLSRLADSLSRVLRDFYPLAGRLRLTPGEGNRYELLYRPGDGVAFTVAQHGGVDVDELARDDPREHAAIAPFVPVLPAGGAVLAVQATVLLLPIRRDLALGVTVHHAACDGSSSTHFLHTWAATCAGAAVLPQPPVINRTCIRDREDIYDLLASMAKDSQPHMLESTIVVVAVDKLLATFAVSGDTLQSIKDRIAAVAARRGVPTPRCTSIVATFAVIWHCHTRAAQGDVDVEADSTPSPNDGDRGLLVCLSDLRPRMDPRVPDKYLGNCVGPCFAWAARKEIAATGADDALFTASSAIALAIDGATRCEADYWDRCTEQGQEMRTLESPPVSVAGSPRFRVYDVDFGFGKPAKVEVVSIAKTGAVSVAESRRRGSGGIEVGVALPPEQMERFRRCFGDAMAWLSSSSPQ
uniref:Uncharacterized protein n=1 Tax=Oryza brachyantha TaxID=4533 RepID=J3LCW7_ORYBR